ncbi:5-hydroxytryptamine receptor 2B-like isoform X1 [Polyodon spathula]|uniref:5-hydroxytryptamine receptor 2B-like isoform X1 n=1 Tax=Polyodon spathula TaxID=7913 RepID=UPI001B7E4D7A|nr:5-hydroxytryptamine receptor 2B-like isoform X1 [Polyodon spathula]XP_041118739.1 5-hydroxytryptamine receptor 2B-like isoform X1 [Polyodon spathula]
MLAKPQDTPGPAKTGKHVNNKDMSEHGGSISLQDSQMQWPFPLAANSSYSESFQPPRLSALVGVPGAAQGGGGGEELCWAALLIIVFIIPTLGGNILVILAVSLERKLQNATNYFLMSLAVADLLVGLLVMPIALTTVLFNSEWPLPTSLCPIWIFLDVLFSTASIMHLCAISLDRYIAIKKPIQHSQFKSRAKAMGKIAVVWLISIGIAIPIPIKGLQDETNTFKNKTCLLNNDRFRGFIIFGSTAAFFVPLAIMMVIYLLTIQVLRKKAYLLRFKTHQRFTWSTVSTIFQRELPPSGSSPEQEVMLDSSRKEVQSNVRVNNNDITGKEIPIRRMSAMGKKSMQNISNEQRASKVLGIVFFLFVVMWCPFFITNVASVFCETCSQEVLGRLMDIFVWVGYVASGINPLVYTLFNKTFRKAFSRYITCDYGGSRPPKVNRKTLTRISFRSSMAENSKLFMKHSMRNGISPVPYQSPLCLRPAPTCIQSSTTILLDTLFLTENEGGKQEEQETRHYQIRWRSNPDLLFNSCIAMDL